MNALTLLRQEEHLSCSAIGTYLRCPRMFEHRYLRKTPEAFRPGALAFGSAVHESLAAFYLSLKEGQEMNADALVDVFKAAWENQQNGELPVLLGDKETPDSLAEMGAQMLRVFHADAERPHRVLEVEMPWSVELIDPRTGDVLPRLVGAFDAVVENADGSISILEHKTAARRWTSDRLTYDLQLSGYAMAAPQLGFVNPKIVIQLLLKTQKSGFETYPITRTNSDELEFAETAAGVHRAKAAGVFYPIRDWHCNGCVYASECVTVGQVRCVG